MLKLSTIALILAAGSFLPVYAEQPKPLPAADKSTSAAPADPAAVSKWMGQAVERMLDGDTADSKAGK